MTIKAKSRIAGMAICLKNRDRLGGSHWRYSKCILDWLPQFAESYVGSIYKVRAQHSKLPAYNDVTGNTLNYDH